MINYFSRRHFLFDADDGNSGGSNEQNQDNKNETLENGFNQ